MSSECARRLKWAWQRAIRGYDQTASWDLSYYIASIAAPVLKSMHDCGSPASLTQEGWNNYLNKMAIAMELIAKDKVIYTEEEEKQIATGLKLFSTWFRALWT
jgi:hypothetical protein